MMLQGLAVHIQHNSELLEYLENLKRPGRPKRGEQQRWLGSPQARLIELRRLRLELKEAASKMAWMFNSLL